jgi:hypothetical protein
MKVTIVRHLPLTLVLKYFLAATSAIELIHSSSHLICRAVDWGSPHYAETKLGIL